MLIFDFDGVLADTLPDMLRVAAHVCASLGHPRVPTPADLEALDHMSFRNYGKQLGLPPGQLDAFVRDSLALFIAREQPPPIFDGVADVVRKLAERHKIGVVTGNTAPVVHDFLVHHGLSGVVRVVLDADAPGTRAEKIRRAAGLIGEPGVAVYVIGDAVSDIRAAREAGAKSVAVTWGHQSRAKLLGAGPDFVVETPAELLALFFSPPTRVSPRRVPPAPRPRPGTE